MDVAHSWGLQRHVKICATTGRAAALLGGMTIHELVHLFANSVSLDKFADELSDAALIIADEVSMLKRRELGQINRSVLCNISNIKQALPHHSKIL